jgi:hypothetical protein
MRITRTTTLLAICVALPCAADDGTAKASDAERERIHRESSAGLGGEQDELAADVQQLVIEQTIPQVIQLLGEVEDIMGETTDYLLESDTGGKTIAAQTEIIEKIHAAAKKRQQQGGSGQSGGAMMDMMERMMGKKPGEGKAPGKQGDKPGEQAGQGATGESDTANEASGGDNTGKVETRTVPKASGTAGRAMPDEFQKALDAYNRGVEKMVK